jgi:vitamin B12 transporter
MDLNVTNGVDGYNPARIGSLQGSATYRLTSTLQLIARFLGSTSFSKVNTSPEAITDFPSGTSPAIPLAGAPLAQFAAGVPLSSINTGSATYIPSVNDPDSSRDGRFETGALSLVGQPTEKLGYAVEYQVVNSTRNYGNGPGGPGYQPAANTYSDYSGRIQTLNARANYNAARYSLFTFGYEFENENYGDMSSTAGLPADTSVANVTQTSHTGFMQDQARFFDNRLYVAAAVRVQMFELQQPTFLPASQAPYQNMRFNAPPAAYTGDASIAYTLDNSGTKIRAHVGRGYRAPALFERFGSGYDPFFGYSVYGDPELKPEQSIAVDTGIDQSLLNNRLRLSATYFYTHLQRVITFDTSGLINPLTDPFGRDIGYLNTRGGFARGVEFNADWAVRTALTLSGSYTYTDAREETPLVPNVYRSFNTPRNQFSVFVVQRFGPRTFVDFTLSAADSYLAQVYSSFSSGAFQFPGYKRGDLGISYRFPLKESRSLRLFAKAENIFDQTYYESGFPTPGVTARGGVQFEF